VVSAVTTRVTKALVSVVVAADSEVRAVSVAALITMVVVSVAVVV